MPIAVILVIALLIGLSFCRGKLPSSEPSVTVSPLPEQNVFTLRSEEDRDVIVMDGEEYFSWEGEWDAACGAPVWDWHGRMGRGLGFLARDGSLFADGEVYTLRGREEILLAYLPSDGWPITDMKLFLREGDTLPAVRVDGFSFGEVYRIVGEFPEEEMEKVCDLSDPALIASLAEVWLRGEDFDPPEVEYDRYRLRLYSAEVPGLYVNVNLSVNEALRCCAVERHRFSGISLFPM